MKQTHKIVTNHFAFSLDLWIYHKPLSCYKQESLGHKARLEDLHCGFCFFSGCNLHHKDISR